MIAKIRKDINFEKSELNTHNHSMVITANNLNDKNESIEYNNKEDFINNSINHVNHNKIKVIDCSIEKNNSILISPIYINLIEFGYSEKCSNNLISCLRPINLDQALEYLSEINGTIQHYYIEDFNSEIGGCFICGRLKNDHKDDEYEIRDDDISINLYNSTNFHNNNNHNNYNINNNINYNNFDSIELRKGDLNDFSSDKNSSINIGERFICPICFRTLGENKRIILYKCQHYFCKTCLYNYLKTKILENKLTFIKCLDYECNEKLSNELIINIISKNKKLLEKYKLLSLKLEIINDPNKKFCPYPNCNSFLTRNKDPNIKISKCENEHEYCFICLNKPHQNKTCEEKIDDNNIKEYAKNKFIKKCPNCGTYTEKNEGCNHITCAECNYQWCWLCNQKYTERHYLNGKCRGYQFFQPHNEEDIKLALEGKIILNEDERQLDINDNSIRCDFTFIEIVLSCLISFLFFLTGQPVTLICLQPHFIKIEYSYYTRLIMALCYDFCIVYLWISYFFLQIFINILTFIFHQINFGYTDFIDTFMDYLSKILDFNVFEDFEDFDEYKNIPLSFELILKFILNLFFGTILIYYKIMYNNFKIYLNKGNQFCSILYFYCFLCINLFEFFFQILINLIFIIFKTRKYGIEVAQNALSPKFIYS